MWCVRHAEVGVAAYVSGTLDSGTSGLGFEVGVTC